ncbi:ribonuclease H-like domain-containing protein [Mycena latifolia]|nr:ribonuclease H-like domain-containing protein [Mycena latifolia]
MSNTLASFLAASTLPGGDAAESPCPLSTAEKQLEAEKAAYDKAIAVKDELGFSTIKYITSEEEADKALAAITEGAVGLDIEFGKRILYGDEARVDQLPTISQTAKKNARQALQYLEAGREGFSIKGENIGLYTIQIAQFNIVWILNMNRIKAYPKELRRILTSEHITKVGVGILNDAIVVWEDLRTDMQNLADVGHRAGLVAAKEILHVTIDKSFQKTVDWKAEPTEAHKLYAALDAAVSLRL